MLVNDRVLRAGVQSISVRRSHDFQDMYNDARLTTRCGFVEQEIELEQEYTKHKYSSEPIFRQLWLRAIQRIMSAGQHAKMLALYRNIIRHAQVYPSKSRDRVLREIRSEFRKNASETDLDKVNKQRQIAMKGLEQLMMYTTMDKTSMNMSVTLEQNPLGAPPTQQR